MPYYFTISFADIYGNVHNEAMTAYIDGGLDVKVTATYVDHDDWLSPIDVPDFEDWEDTYGTEIEGSAIDNDDGTMTGTVALLRAGTYTLSVTVNGDHVSASPHTPFEVAPDSIYTPFCVFVNLPETLTIGQETISLIQGRDLYHNNLKATLEEATSNLHKVLFESISIEGFTFSADVSDSEYLGVYQFKTTPPSTIEYGFYNLNITLAYETIQAAQIEILAALVEEEELLVEQSKYNIEFDEDAVTDDTLFVYEQRLGPFNLNCETEWSKTLPPIKGEDGRKVSFEILLGGAATFIEWDPDERRLTHLPMTTYFEKETFVVKIILINADD